ncbi:MAG: phosphoethanolamine transferase [Puniceicoccales bacterium]|jgi:glucan phosphoethanolaminetransferase (alkaline phosphatase superfamily)|nr:phosphoethanolamine transferase [Puniceicoccales bacterium]
MEDARPLSKRAKTLTAAGAAVALLLSIWGAKPDAMPLVLPAGTGLLALGALCWRSPWSRAVSVLLALAWSFNIMTTAVSKIVYSGLPSTYIAEAILATNRTEAAEMFWANLEWLPAFAALLAGFLALFAALSRTLPARVLRGGALALAVLLGVLCVVHGVRHRSALQVTLRTTTKTPFFHAASLLGAHASAKAQNAAGGLPPPVVARVATDTGVEAHVLIIGESVRRRHLHLYGAARDTSPREDAERSRMLVFTQAVAPAGNTIAAIPRTLRPLDARGNFVAHPDDNIVVLANLAGMRTFWLSNQEDFNPNFAVITAIAARAQTVAWNHRGDDDVLLPKLDAALKTPGRKLIILHLMGSHEPVASRFPETSRFFTGGDSREDDYDNSLRHTDALLGKIFDRLRGERGSVLYYADHALVRKKQFWGWKYRHGGGVREAYEIPLWIWWAPPVAKPPRLGVENAPYSTGENYHLLRDWLGIETPGRPSPPSPLRAGWKPSPPVVDGGKRFDELPPE